MVENHQLKEEIERLKHATDMLRKTNDDVCKQFSEENFRLKKRLHWCQAQTNVKELKLQSQHFKLLSTLQKHGVFQKFVSRTQAGNCGFKT